jgi:hypothetical protein
MDGEGVWHERECRRTWAGRAGANTDMECRRMRGMALALSKKKRKEKEISGKFIGPDTAPLCASSRHKWILIINKILIFLKANLFV